MRVSQKQVFIAAGLLIIGAGAYFFWSGKSDPAGKQPRGAVVVVKTGVAQQKAIPISIQTNGYVVPFSTVDVRPQTQNIVRTVHVREGQDVRAGQLLFTLDQRNDSSNVAKSEAEVASGRAELAEAEASLKRNRELLAKGFVSQAVVDSARSKVEALRGSLKAGQASVQSSTIALSNNRITAGIAGRLGAISVHPGSLAQPGGTPMVTIAQIDPIAVSFSVPERELAHIVASYPKGDAPVVAQLAGNQEVEGKLFFIDNTSDQQSGTIRMKAQFANPDRKMWPGSFATVRLVSRILNNAVAIPAQAVVIGPEETFVYVVQPDETVKKQKIDVVTVEKGQAAVIGLASGARVVIEGAQNLRPSAKVKEAQSAPSEAGKKGA